METEDGHTSELDKPCGVTISQISFDVQYIRRRYTGPDILFLSADGEVGTFFA